jgi:catechol 2,3-dioxygenase-like lactoylglutathione lyase family enzyme
MPGLGIIPSIRSNEAHALVAFYRDVLGFDVLRDEPGEGNYAVGRGDARLMIEMATGAFYGDAYNAAIRERVGRPSAAAFYIEAPDLEDLYARTQTAGAPIIDPLGPRPWGQAEFTIADPDGNWLTFYRALPKA